MSREAVGVEQPEDSSAARELQVAASSEQGLGSEEGGSLRAWVWPHPLGAAGSPRPLRTGPPA